MTKAAKEYAAANPGKPITIFRAGRRCRALQQLLQANRMAPAFNRELSRPQLVEEVEGRQMLSAAEVRVTDRAAEHQGHLLRPPLGIRCSLKRVIGDVVADDLFVTVIDRFLIHGTDPLSYRPSLNARDGHAQQFPQAKMMGGTLGSG